MNARPQIVSFDEALEDVTGGNAKTLQSDFLPDGKYAIVDQGKDLVAGYTDDDELLCQAPLPLIVFGDHTKAIKFVDFPFGLGADGTKVLRPKDGFEPRYLFHYLRTVRLPDAGYSRHFKYLRDVKFPRPKPEDQRRIATILDATEALRQKRRQALQLLDQLSQSMFIEMFGDLSLNDRGWRMAEVQDFVAGFESGKSLVADDEEDTTSKFRVLKVSAVTSLFYRADESKPLPPDYVPPDSHIVKPGDLLFSRANTSQLIGATALVEHTPPNHVLPDKIWRFVWHDEPRADPYFVWHLFRQRRFRDAISSRATGTSGSMKNISQDKVLSIPIALPPLDLQQQFGRQLKATLSSRALAEAALHKQDVLFSSLQHRAFRGEL